MKKILCLCVIVVSLLLLCSCQDNADTTISTTEDAVTNSQETSNIATEATTVATITEKVIELKTEEEMLADIQSRDLFDASEIFDGIKIIKRQTRTEDFLDTVFVTVDSHAEYTRNITSFKLVYGLYNEGWILDSVENYWDGENDIIPLQGPGIEWVDSIFALYNSEHPDSAWDSSYVSWTVVDYVEDLENRSATYYIEASREVVLWESKEQIVIHSTFNNGWHFPGTLEEGIQEIKVDRTKLLGDYYGKDSYFGDEVYLSIYSVDEENQTITLSCSYHDYGGDTKEWEGTFSFSTDTHELPNMQWRMSMNCDLGAPVELEINKDSIFFSDICLFDGTD